MKRLWVWREVDAPVAALWALLVDVEQWPCWGPSVRAAAIDGGQLALGATGTVTTIVGVNLPFEITEYDPCVGWAWKVAGMPATDHRLTPLGEDRCRIGFGVPWPVAPYLIVCRTALKRLERLAALDEVGT